MQGTRLHPCLEYPRSRGCLRLLFTCLSSERTTLWLWALDSVFDRTSSHSVCYPTCLLLWPGHSVFSLMYFQSHQLVRGKTSPSCVECPRPLSTQAKLRSVTIYSNACLHSFGPLRPTKIPAGWNAQAQIMTRRAFLNPPETIANDYNLSRRKHGHNLSCLR